MILFARYLFRIGSQSYYADNLGILQNYGKFFARNYNLWESYIFTVGIFIIESIRLVKRPPKVLLNHLVAY